MSYNFKSRMYFVISLWMDASRSSASLGFSKSEVRCQDKICQNIFSLLLSHSEERSRICKRNGILLVILWLFSLILFLSNQITHALIYLSTYQNSEASRSELVCSLSAFESIWCLTVCLLTFCNQLGTLKSELIVR